MDICGRIPKKYFFVILVFLFLFPVFLFARDIEIAVEDEDLAWPLEGAAVILRGGVQFICDEDGIARVTLPDDRQTIITISYPGYEPLRMTIPAADASGAGTKKFKAALRLGGVMTSQELVLEAARPETSETKSGRSVAISERELTRTAEIGMIEDVMNSVKLLPGVGYTGMFSAMPSIRGGDPGDLMATLDGFYLDMPYHWMGSISIFDPKMVSSARLSHGVFSTRYGHTVSGLLEVTSKSPSPTETDLEAAIGSSATSLNLSIPLAGKGGILFMGKVTYWDTLILAAQGLSKVIENETLEMVNAITTSPYIRSAAASMNYRFTPHTEMRINGFIGADGVGMDFETDYSQYTEDDIEGVMKMKADYGNYQGFLTSGLTASPLPIMALRFTSGVGFRKIVTEDFIDNRITAAYNEDFLSLLPPSLSDDLRGKYYTAPNLNITIDAENNIFNAQARADADIELGRGFITAFGVQELYSIWETNADIALDIMEQTFESMIENINKKFKDNPELAKMMIAELENSIYPIIKIKNAAYIPSSTFSTESRNHGFTTSAYSLIEYSTPNQRFGFEAGLRVDHLYYKGKNFDINTKPALNPRLNLDFGIIKNRGIFNSITATAGTGLFSSMNELISLYDPTAFESNDIEFKPNRTWTSVVGVKVDFLEKFSFNIEGYYKYVFNRGYIPADISSESITASSVQIKPTFMFDGIGNVYGFDLQLQKMESRYWDGWISYTFTWAKYLDPSAGGVGISNSNIDLKNEWYYPSFHRFHNFNLVLNIKPMTWFNIGIRFGFASGQPVDKPNTNPIIPYPVQVVDKNGAPMLDDEGKPLIIQKYKREDMTPEQKGIERTAWSLPLDIKLSFFPVSRYSRASMEIYFAGENLLSLVYNPTSSSTTFNSYTGKEDSGSSSANFDLPIPMVSFGIKWRY